MAVPPVTLSGVTKRYGAVTALQDVSAAFDSGRVHAVAGANGSGKTTLFRLVAGLTRPTSGCVDAGGASVGIAFQEPSVYRDLTVGENLATFAAVTGADEDWRTELVDRLELGSTVDRRVGALSAGFAKKLDLALALLAQPDVVLLDEPLADVDASTGAALVTLLAEYADAGRTVLLSTHNVDRFAGVVDRLVVLREGRLAEDVTGDALPERLEAAAAGTVRGND
ncbi:MAG: ATP-binding cassette domain-containing protein [Halobacteriaceae archaeon]